MTIDLPPRDREEPRGLPAVYSSAALRRLQRRHFLLFDVMPAIGAVLAVALWRNAPPSAVDLVVFFLLWLTTGLGLTVGFHRYFTHRSFEANRECKLLLLAMGSMAARGPMISWVAMHRRHHECSDREGDLHSPNLNGSKGRGWLHAHLTWMIRHDYPNVVRYAPDLLRDKALMQWNRHYYLFVVLGLALPALIGGLAGRSVSAAFVGFLWGGLTRIFVVEHTMSAINSLCHLVGSRPFDTGDNSRNIPLLGLLSWGEAYHNNHHAFPYSAAFGLRRFELDPGYWFILALRRCGVVRDVKVAAQAGSHP